MDVSSRRTPYRSDYPSCSEARCSLLIYPGQTTPDEVSRRLQIEPTTVRVAGATVVSAFGVPRVNKFNGWFLSSEGAVDSKDLRHHLDWLLDRLAPTGNALRDLQSLPGLTMGVNCVWHSRAGHGGPTLWPKQMQAMSALNLECSFDIYFFGDDAD